MTLRMPSAELAAAPSLLSTRDRKVWAAISLVVLGAVALAAEFPWMVTPPPELMIPVDVVLNVAMDWFIANFKWLFRTFAWILSGPLIALTAILQWLPWPATIFLVATLAHFFGGWRLAVFCAAALFYMAMVGYWEESMNTLALAGISVPLSLSLGLSAGILGFRSSAARRVIEPVLDLMQTIPTFAYLIPIILLFGFGPVVGLVAGMIYATPPMVRNVMLGLSRVPADIIDSARMAGSNKRQLLWWVQVPSALPTIMVGVNQTIMAALTMIIIASLIGGSKDIGFEVLGALRKAQFGQSLLIGAVIVLIAMVMDRISRAAAERQSQPRYVTGSFWQRHRHAGIAAGATIVLIVLGQVFPSLREYPKDLVFFPAQPLNDAVLWFTINFFPITEAIKTWLLFLFMLPLRVGLENSATPYFWGFTMTTEATTIYSGLIFLMAAAASYFWRWWAAVAILLVGVLYYHGTTGVPWPAFMLIVIAITYRIGGWRLGLFALGTLLFIVLGGAWHRAMLSLYLCGVAIIISFTIGGLLGVWAAHNDRVSAFLRPISDTLQTLPSFVYLVPIVMVYLLGEFTALLAIIAYSVVPSIRYTEHGLRNVPHHIVEAATAFGCTRRQLLFEVKLPLALPEIMLGLNQTVMFGLAMLVITALVGTSGLGAMVYRSLTVGNFGMGVIAGGSIALIAMTIDRTCQTWSEKRKRALGLA